MRRRSAFALIAAVLAGPVVLSLPAGAVQADRRIIAIGDIHGAYDSLVTILTRTGLMDAKQQWTGGRTMLVQTGDFTDRGAQVRQVMDLLMTIESRARGGGQVIQLLGNHEVFNIIGDLRYVTPEIAATFADDKSEARREQAWTQYAELAPARAKVRPAVPAVYQQTREAWMAAHPPGWLEYREALGPRGKYGRWLRSKPIATLQAGTIFMHAGISPDQPATVDQVNARAREEMARYEAYFQRLIERKLALPFFTFQEVLQVSGAELETVSAVMEAAKVKGEQPDLSAFDVPTLREAVEIVKMTDWSLLACEGPLWFRGYANWPEDEVSLAKVTGFLDKSGVTRIVVGHTPQKEGRIAARFGARVLIIDTGMLVSTYNGRPAALEIVGPKLTAIYADGEQPLTPSAQIR